MKKALALMIAMLMVVSMFAACQKPDEPDKGDSGTKAPASSNAPDASGSQGESNKDPEPSETEPDMGIPSDLRYDDATVYIFHWNHGTPEFGVDPESLDGDPVADAVYKRNMYTEDRLGITLDFTGHADSVDLSQQFCDAIKNRISDPTTPVDITASYARTAATAAIQGLLADLNQIDTLDLTKSWWPKNVQEEYNVKDRLYFISGDISTTLIYNMSVMFYNTELVTARGFEDPAQMAIDGDWTLDEMIEMVSGSYEDIDETSGKSAGDFFGFACRYWWLDNMYQAHGFKIVEASNEDDEVLKYSDELFGPVIEQWISKMQSWLCTDDFLETADSTNMFKEGRLMFQSAYAYTGESYRDTDIKYGILPLPKLDADQENYISSPSNTFTLFGLSAHSPDAERAGATMQVLSYWGQQLSTPAVFEITLKGKYSKTDEMLDIWDIIVSTLSFDMGRLFQKQLSAPEDMITKAICNNSNWATVTSPLIIRNREKMLDKIDKAFWDVIEAS